MLANWRGQQVNEPEELPGETVPVPVTRSGQVTEQSRKAAADRINLVKKNE